MRVVGWKTLARNESERCEWLIKSVIVYLMIPCYMDNCGNSRANTCIKVYKQKHLLVLH